METSSWGKNYNSRLMYNKQTQGWIQRVMCCWWCLFIIRKRFVERYLQSSGSDPTTYYTMSIALSKHTAQRLSNLQFSRVLNFILCEKSHCLFYHPVSLPNSAALPHMSSDWIMSDIIQRKWRNAFKSILSRKLNLWVWH